MPPHSALNLFLPLQTLEVALHPHGPWLLFPAAWKAGSDSLASLRTLTASGGRRRGKQQAGRGKAETELPPKTHKLVPERNGASFLPISSLPQPLPGKQHESLGWLLQKAGVADVGDSLGQPHAFLQGH